MNPGISTQPCFLRGHEKRPGAPEGPTRPGPGALCAALCKHTRSGHMGTVLAHRPFLKARGTAFEKRRVAVIWWPRKFFPWNVRFFEREMVLGGCIGWWGGGDSADIFSGITRSQNCEVKKGIKPKMETQAS